MNRIFKQIAVAALAVTAVAAPAAAQGISIGPNGVRVEDPRDTQRSDRNDRRASSEVTEREAVRSAKREGVREVEDVRRTKSSYKVEGTDRSGDDIAVTVDRQTGDVLSVR